MCLNYWITRELKCGSKYKTASKQLAYYVLIILDRTDLQMYWKSPYLWEVVSIPPPMTRPPIVKSSSSGTTGKVQPFAIQKKVKLSSLKLLLQSLVFINTIVQHRWIWDFLLLGLIKVEKITYQFFLNHIKFLLVKKTIPSSYLYKVINKKVGRQDNQISFLIKIMLKLITR